MYTEKWYFIGQDGKTHLTRINHSRDKAQMDHFYSIEQASYDEDPINVKFPGRSHMKIKRERV